jgi:transposase
MSLYLLTQEQEAEIDRMIRADYRHKEVAAKFGVSQATVTRAVARFRGIKSPKRVKPEPISVSIHN